MDKKYLNSERVYALDALRAIMMLLGIVLHAAITYGAVDYQTAWPLKDPNQGLVFDIIVAFIHAFRMPVFFVTAGYFSALLFYKKGPNAMLINRLKRIVLPFIAGVLLVYPLVVIAFYFSNTAFAEAKSPSKAVWEVIFFDKLLSFKMVHLLFLSFFTLLVFYSLIGWLLAKAFHKSTVFTRLANTLFVNIIQNFWLRLFCMAVTFFLCLYCMSTTFKLVHLWFLYFLAFYSLIGWLLAKAFHKSTVFTRLANTLFVNIIQNFWLRLFCMAVTFFLCLYWMGTTFILTNTNWRIEPIIFVAYFILFGTGWMIYKTNTLLKLTEYSIGQLSVAILLLLINGFLTWYTPAWVLPLQIMFAAVYSSLLVFGFIAFFLTYFNQYSRLLTYLMDASYWVYIIHLPIVSFIPGLMANMLLPAFVKFSITLSTTFIISMVSYKYFVRSSIIGLFLNGKVYKRKRMGQTEELLVRS